MYFPLQISTYLAHAKNGNSIFLDPRKHTKDVSLSIRRIQFFGAGSPRVRSERLQWVKLLKAFAIDTVQPQNTCFFTPFQASLTVLFQCFLLTTFLHPKVCHFFLSEWYHTRRIPRIRGRFSSLRMPNTKCYNIDKWRVIV